MLPAAFSEVWGLAGLSDPVYIRVMMTRWKEFRASEAERLTGMDAETQRVKRRRGQLTPVQTGKARFDGVLLAEMLVVHRLAAYGVVSGMTLTARALAASWVAFWAVEALHNRETAARLTGRRQSPPPTHMISPHATTHWRQTMFTDAPGDALAQAGNAIALVVDMRALGRELAQRAGVLTEARPADGDPGYLVE
jgi:hypothetical protein